MEHNLFLINIQKIMTSFVFAFLFCFVITAREWRYDGVSTVKVE